MKFSKEAIEEAAKLSKMSVGDYLDKLPSSFYEEAAKQSGFSNQEYLGKLKSIYSEPLKKKEDTQFGGTATANGTQNTTKSKSVSVSPSNVQLKGNPINFQIPGVQQQGTGNFSLNRNVSTKPTPKDVLGKGIVVPKTIPNTTINEYQVDITDKSADATKTQVKQQAQIQNDVDTGVLEQRNKFIKKLLIFY